MAAAQRRRAEGEGLEMLGALHGGGQRGGDAGADASMHVQQGLHGTMPQHGCVSVPGDVPCCGPGGRAVRPPPPGRQGPCRRWQPPPPRRPRPSLAAAP